MPDQQSEIMHRLHCAAGHLNAVIEMTEEGQPCEQVLHQLNAVQAALQAIGVGLIACQIQNSGMVILDSSCQKAFLRIKASSVVKVFV